jgi:hypothetical protein
MHGQQSHPPTDPPPSGCMKAIAVVVLIRYLGRMKIDSAGLMSWVLRRSLPAGSAMIGAPGPGSSPTKMESGILIEAPKTTRWSGRRDVVACRFGLKFGCR